MSAEHIRMLGFHLNAIRNICAHHNPLWNSVNDGAAGIPKITLPDTLSRSMAGADPSRLHNTLLILYHLLSIIEPEAAESWRSQALALLDRHQDWKPAAHPDLPDGGEWIPAHMGFPKDWRTRPAWHTSIVHRHQT